MKAIYSKNIIPILAILVAMHIKAQPSLQLTRCLPPGAKDSVLCGTYPVFENRTTGKGRKISLSIIVIPASDSSAKLPPVFMIEGGPGVAASSGLSYYSLPGNPYRKQHDIVLVDIRGTGNSNPLHCNSLQYAENLQNRFTEMYPAVAVKTCYDSLSKIADLTQYNTINAVKDLEEIRQWLGYKKINLMGVSYGTRVAQVYMKLFPSSLSGIVLMSPTSFSNRMPLYHAKFAQQGMSRLLSDCKNDSGCFNSFPNIRREFSLLMKRWKQNPVSYKHTSMQGKTLYLNITWEMFHTKIRSLMYSPSGLRIVPYLIHEAYTGNLKPFVSLYSGEPKPDLFLAEGFYLCVTCTEDIPFIKDQEIELQVKNTFMGTYRIDQQKKACALWTKGKLPANFFQPVASDIPVLIISGDFDPVTPVSLAKEIAEKLSNSKMIVIPAMSHLFDGLSHEECFDNIVVGFLQYMDPQKVNSECVTGMKPPPYKTME